MSKINSITPGWAPVIDTEKKDFLVKKHTVKKSKSDHAQSLIESIIKEADLSTPEEVDPELLASVKSAIAEGKYQIDTEYLAENLINEYFRKEEK